ncbi:DNA-binding SARP family transcriptional activator [Nonomuraea endophytica]|uniref:DNA-binding SARP family transcriptional activator n=1 Tax=Nonomuraea endophytica TaxID=714136 RepID=A0A7W8A4X8_9ACTN|nr:DNA-binding SARP family transcriptional activator [Nonomuraea endophytica]
MLGPVQAWRGGRELGLGSPQQRLVLAVLLLANGRVVGGDQLMDAVWGHVRPRTAANVLRTYISRLRAVLGADAVVSVGDGYALRAGTCDVAELRTLYGEGRYAEALALWQGEPLAGLDGDYAEAQRARLSEQRLVALEHRLGQDLDEGKHAEVVVELSALAAEHPTRERLRGLLMLALYRAGRQAEAIGVYTDTRKLLADELGVDPSPELAELYQQIISADPALGRAPARPRAAAAPAARHVPRQLPADVADFTGRESEVEAMAAALRPGRSSALVVCAVAGAGGVGKTALAVHVAHRLAGDYPDGQLFVDLRGSGSQPLEVELVLGSLLRALGLEEAPEELAERAALYRSMLADRRMLVVLDNAAGAGQVRPLLPGSATCGVLVTSRARLIGLSGARQVDLEVLGPVAALRLFARIVGEQRAEAERGAAMDLVAACGFLPLAIRIAAARLAARPNWSVAGMRDRLSDERRRLSELRAGDLAIEATFALGYEQLDEAHARAFRLLAVPDMADVSLRAAAALLDLPEQEAEAVCEALVDVSMLESLSPGRYRFHDLLRVFARSRVDPAAADAALDRLLDHSAAAVAGRFRSLFPGDRRAELLPTAECEDAFDPADTEALLSVVRQAATRKDADRYRLAWIVDMLTDVAPESVAFRHTLDLLVTRAGDEPRAEGLARYLRSTLSSADRQARRSDALAAIDLARGDHYVTAVATASLGVQAYDDGDYQASVELIRRGLDIFAAGGDRGAQALWLGLLARSLAAADEPGQAVEAARSAYRVHAELGGGTPRHPWAPYQLAFTLQAVGALGEALRMYESAVTGFREIGELDWIGTATTRMADIHLTLGDHARALELAEQGLAALREADDEHWQGKALMILGQALTATGQRERGHACYTEALEIFDRLRLPEAEDVRSLLAAVNA